MGYCQGSAFIVGILLMQVRMLWNKSLVLFAFDCFLSYVSSLYKDNVNFPIFSVLDAWGRCILCICKAHAGI